MEFLLHQNAFKFTVVRKGKRTQSEPAKQQTQATTYASIIPSTKFAPHLSPRFGLEGRGIRNNLSRLVHASARNRHGSQALAHVFLRGEG